MPSTNGTSHAAPADRGAPTETGRERDRHHSVAYPVDSQVVADPGGTRVLSAGHPAFPKPEKKRRHWARWFVLSAIAALVIAAALR